MPSPLTSISSFCIGGSAVCVAAREVAVEDRVEQAFRGCRNPLAVAAVAAARGEASASSPSPEKGINLTARWLGDNYRKVYPALVSHLSAKMPLSRGLSVIEDHVQTVLARFVEKDTLAPFLRDGKPVKLSVLRVWAYQSASTDLRRWGVDASTRAIRGAKTAREVLAGKSWRVVQSASPAREIVRDREGRGSPADLHDPNDVSPEDRAARRSRVDLVRRHLTRIGQPHLVSAVEHVLNGGDVSDLPKGTAAQLTTALIGLRA